MPSRITRYSRSHEFSYPKYGRKLRRLSDRPLWAKASRGEDSAYSAYRALRIRDPDVRRRRIKRIRRAAKRPSWDNPSYDS